ncbi:MAG TPA: thioesterase domain-containing protein [Chryseolinea sp.]|nr:thioesterase domain-containing protein [Chryseolinea sp.]
MSVINLYCLPFAGGNKYSYRGYEEKAPAAVKIVTLEYPGRGTRLKEALITDMEQLVEDAFKNIRPLIRDQPYALYGHSMGGVVAFLLSKKIISEGNLAAPLHIFITGTMGPSRQSKDAINRHLLPKKEFIEEMRTLDGCPEEILENEEMLSYFEPILRADFEASETFRYQQGSLLNIPFTVITGNEELMEEEDIATWQMETSDVVDFRRMPGKHFFIFEHSNEILKVISQKLIAAHKICNHDRP